MLGLHAEGLRFAAARRLLMDHIASTASEYSLFLKTAAFSLIILTAGYILYFYTVFVRRPKLYYVRNGRNLKLLHRCPTLHRFFVPTIWALHANVQTIVNFLRFFKPLPLDRKLIVTGDGGTVSLDFVKHHEDDPSKPLVIVLPGATGGSHSRYIRAFCTHLSACNFRYVVVNWRGCSGTPVTTPRLVKFSESTDVAFAMTKIRNMYPNCPLLGVGFSMGSNFLTKYLGEVGEASPLVAAMSISNPFDLVHCYYSKQSLFRLHVYDRHVTNEFKRMVKASSDIWTNSSFDLRRLENSRSIKDLDEVFSRHYGYESVHEYWNESSCGPWVDRVETPMLFVQALSDCFFPADCLPLDIFTANPNLLLATTIAGGHVAWLEGFIPIGTSWIDRVAGEFLTAAVAELSVD